MIRRPGDPVRRFTLLDAMILVAATAIAIPAIWSQIDNEWTDAFVPSYWDRVQGGWRAWPGVMPAVFIADVIELARPCLATWTLALLALRLRRPRPTRRRLLLRPGMVACVAAACVLCLNTLGLLAFLLLELCLGRGVPIVIDKGIFSLTVTDWSVDQVAFAVLAAWICLVLGGRRRPERSWIDRGGRALGDAWILAALSHWWRWLILSVIFPADIAPH
jgi:hypothetical protein